MKKLFTTLMLALFAFAYTPAHAQSFTVSEASISGAANFTPTANDAYRMINGIGGAGGFALASSGVVDATHTDAAGDMDVVGQVLTANTDVIAEETNVGAGTFTADLSSSTSDDLCPGGFTVGGQPADTCGFFFGASGVGSPLAFDQPACVTSATIQIFIDGASAGGPFDISGFGSFTAGPVGDWDGNTGVTFGAGSSGVGIDAFQFIVGYINRADCNAPLPVELTAFESTVSGSDVTLNWATASEVNNAGFHIEHSIDGDTFESLDFVEGFGNTTEVQNYSHTLRDLAVGTHHFRLKQIDFDGTFEYTEAVEAVVTVPEGYLIGEVYPNPFNPSTTLEIGVETTQDVRVDIYNLTGQMVTTAFAGELAANQMHPVRIALDGLPSGQYIATVRGTNWIAHKVLTMLK